MDFKYIFGFVLILLGNSLFSQSSDFIKNPYKRYTIDDGLSQNAVSTIIEDDKGFIWIGTRDGLNRFDGNKFINFTHHKESLNSLRNNTINTLFVDHHKFVWVGTEFGLSKYNYSQDSFSNYIYDSLNAGNLFNNILCINQKDSSNLLVGTKSGLLKFNTDDEEFVGFPLLMGRITKILPSLNDQGHYILTQNSLFHLDQKNIITKLFDFDSWYINQPENFISMQQNAKGDVIILTQSYVIKFFDGSALFIQTNTENNPGNNIDIIKNQNGNLELISTHLKPIKNAYELNHNIYAHLNKNVKEVTNVYISSDGSTWLGSNGYGLLLIPSGHLPFYYVGHESDPEEFSSEYVYSIFTKDDKTIYLGCENYLLKFAKENRQFKKIEYDHPSKTYTIFYDSMNDVLLLGSNGLYELNLETDEITKNNILGDIMINAFHKVEDNKMILGTSGDGAKFYFPKEKTIEHIDLKQAISQNKYLNLSIITSIMSFRGNIWFGTESGLIEWNESEGIINVYTSNTSNPQSITSNHIKTIFVDSKNRLWVGTWGGGLNLFRSETNDFFHYDNHHEFPDNVIYGIIEDDKGFLWLSSNNGLIKFNPDTESWQVFKKNDGLQSNEFNTNSFYKSGNCKIYFGGVNGLTYFNPNDIHISKQYPTTHITKFYFNNEIHQVGDGILKKEIIESDTLFLDYDQTKIGFDFTSIDYSHPEKLRYAYMLAGYEDRWVMLDDRQYLDFNQLPHGNYTLYISSSINGTFEIESAKKLEIIISPPLYMQWWFIVCVILLLLPSPYLYYNWTTKKLRTYNRLLQRKVEERTYALESQKKTIENKNKELEDIRNNLEDKVQEQTQHLVKTNKELVSQNNKLEQFAFVTAHNVSAPIARIKGILNLVEYEKKLGNEIPNHFFKVIETGVKTLQEIISDVNLILELRNKSCEDYENIDLFNLMLDLENEYENKLQEKNINVNLEKVNEATIYGIKPYITDILRNLLSNSIKFSSVASPPEINISFRRQNNKMICEFKDNGLGFDMKYAKSKLFQLYQRFHPNIPGKGMGLFLVKTQLELIDGVIEVESEVDKGTLFTLIFPILSPTSESLNNSQKKRSKNSISELISHK